MLDHDADDPPAMEVGTVLSREQWYAFKVTWPSQLFWLVLYGLIALVGYLIVGVRLSQAMPVCLDKVDTYKLALADMQGTADALWDEFVAEGTCANVPAEYLYTLDIYKSEEVTRVVVMLAFGQRVYALMIGRLPQGVWMIQHEGHPQDLATHDTFYQTWLIPNGHAERKRSCCNKQDCYPTPIRYRDGQYWAQRREDGKWLGIPKGILEQNQDDPRESPDHQSHACIAPPQNGDYVYCATLGAGI